MPTPRKNFTIYETVAGQVEHRRDASGADSGAGFGADYKIVLCIGHDCVLIIRGRSPFR
jgi:hypothetical protein